MLSFSPRQRYYLFGTATDMRKGFSGLGGLVREHHEYDLMRGDVFIFMNKRRDPARKRGPLTPFTRQLLVWDRTGFVVWYKVLEQDTFELPSLQTSTVELPWSDLQMLLEGIELSSIKRRKRYVQTA